MQSKKHWKNREEKEQKTLLSALLALFTTIMYLITAIVYIFEPQDVAISYKTPLIFIALFYTLTYFLSHTKFFKIAAYLFIFQLLSGVFLTSMNDPNIIRVFQTVVWIVVGILLSSFFLPSGFTLLCTILSVLLVILLPILNKTLPFIEMLGISFYILAASLLAYIGARLQKHFIKRANTAEKDAEIQKENAFENFKQLDCILQSMEQGILTINSNLEIDKNYSQFLEEILEKKDLGNKNAISAIFAKSNLNTEQISIMTTALYNIIDENEVAFELNSHALPKKMLFQNLSHEKSIEIFFNPIIIKGISVKVLLILKDVTAIENLKLETQKRNKEMARVFNMLKIPQRQFLNFMETSNTFLDNSRKILNSNSEVSSAHLALIFRNLHTIKGNARLLGFEDLSSIVHEAETYYDKFRLQNEFHLPKADLLSHIGKISNELQAYSDLFADKIASYTNQNENKIMQIANYQKYDIEDKNKPEGESLEILIQPILADLPNLAEKLEKPAPIVQFVKKDLHIPEAFHSVVKDVFMHLFRNSMDHGIESERERLKAGKDLAGKILIIASEDNESVHIDFKDDGRGLDYEKILNRAKKFSLLDEDELNDPQKILECIFFSSFTTKDVVTEISGLGVGLDVVRGFVEESGGRVELILAKPLDRFYPFTIRMVLPKSSAKETKPSLGTLKNIHIVIVEDDVDQLERLENFFASTGIKITCFNAAKNAYTFLLEEKVDVVISDLVMPEMSGEELFINLKNCEKNPGIFIMLTGYFDLRINALVDKGVTIVYAKPISPATLFNFIKQSLKLDL